MKPIPIIDLFAGPGGLGEGFMSYKNENDESVFDIKLSIEKDPNAHKTLTWRSFYRQFVKDGREVPKEYYEAYEEKNLIKREQIIANALNKYPEGAIAKKEAQLVELGSPEWPEDLVDDMISEQLEGEKNWVLIGGPPCQAYSNVGRSRIGGIRTDDHRVYLYKEYLRIIEKHEPAVFVMENVKGLLSATVDGEKVFDWMKEDLKVDGKYHIHSFVKAPVDDKDYLIRSEEFGIPQKRHRVILLGIRKDFKHKEKYLESKPKVSLESVIGELPEIRSALNREFIGSQNQNKRAYQNIVDDDATWVKYINQFLTKVQGWGDFRLNGLSSGAKCFENGIGAEFLESGRTISKKHTLFKWYFDPKLKGIANHESRAHLSQDLMRYLFASLFVEKYGTFPRLEDYSAHSKDLVPDHANVDSGKFNDRFRVQVKDKPATTVTSHISKDGHYFIHYDPKQCRSLTVREAARVQTFPDNYLFCGSRTAQFHQVGNAVPPYLAFQLAEIVKDILN